MNTIKAGVFLLGLILLGLPLPSLASSKITDFKARPPVHVLGAPAAFPKGLSPDQVKGVYHLPKTGGHGTIAIIVAYDDPTIENDLNVFSRAFNLPTCTYQNNCLEKHPMGENLSSNKNWSLETSLDVEWAHAIAPRAKILLIESKTSGGNNLLGAIDYARSRRDVVAVSMSWGGAEFPSEVNLDSQFQSSSGATFFASSGDNGAGVSWPSVSSNVVSVGGTSLGFSLNGNFLKEMAWSGSGGGVSKYEKEPTYQLSYNIPRSNSMRSIPDVSYNADPASGFSVYRSVPHSLQSTKNWYVIGGTSAGAPQWAAIKSLGLSASNEKFYTDKAADNNASYFRDITSGTNGDCTYYCQARKHYDYVTGLGSPQTISF